MNHSSLTLKLIKGDITTAKMCISPIINLFNDESLYSISAYHTQQATEKCLKIMLVHHYGIDESIKRYRTHDIPDLLAFLNECAEETHSPIPISIPNVITELSIEIKEWEANTRYNDNMVILRKNILQVLNACEKMYKDLKSLGYN